MLEHKVHLLIKIKINNQIKIKINNKIKVKKNKIFLLFNKYKIINFVVPVLVQVMIFIKTLRKQKIKKLDY